MVAQAHSNRRDPLIQHHHSQFLLALPGNTGPLQPHVLGRKPVHRGRMLGPRWLERSRSVAPRRVVLAREASEGTMGSWGSASKWGSHSPTPLFVQVWRWPDLPHSTQGPYKSISRAERWVPVASGGWNWPSHFSHVLLVDGVTGWSGSSVTGDSPSRNAGNVGHWASPLEAAILAITGEMCRK